MISRSRMPLATLLPEELPAFTDLSREHGDGWGVASWRGDAFDIRKEPTSAHSSPAFRDTVTTLDVDAALMHIRLANPGSPLVRDNTHPFEASATAFAHNGDFHPAEALDDLLDPALLASVEGTTDSERFFLLVRQELRRNDAVSAVVQAAAAIRGRARYSGLNCLLLTRDSLVAYSDHDPDSAVVQRRGDGYFPLNYRVDPDRVVIASTGWEQDPQEWTRLEDRHVLRVRRSDLHVSRHPAPAALC